MSRPSCDFITLDGETIALLLAPPNMEEDNSVKVTGDFTPTTEVTPAISGRVTGRNFARFARYSIEYQLDVLYFDDEALAATQLRLWLDRLQGETVAVPLWMDGVQLLFNHAAGQTFFGSTGDLPMRCGSEWVVMEEGSDSYEIVTVQSVTSSGITLTDPTTLPWDAGAMFYPLLFGRLDSRPQWKSDTDELFSGTVKVKENSTFDRRLAPLAGDIPVVGSRVPDFATYKLWTLYPDFVNVLDSTEADILYSTLGFVRQDAQYVYQQPPRRALEYGYSLGDRDDVAAIERFFIDRKATTKPFFKPTFRGDMRLFSPLPNANPNLIPVEDGRYEDPDYSSHPGQPYIALIDMSDPNNVGVYPQKLDSIGLAGLVTEEPVLESFAVDTTLVSALILCRFADPILTWSYTNDGIVTTTIKVVEQTSEYVTPNLDLVEKAYLYTLTEKIPNAPQVTLYTSYEAPIVRAGFGTYLPAPFSHGQITGDLQLSDKVDLQTWDFVGNPLAKMLSFTSEGSFSLIIEEVSVDTPNDGTADEIFQGDLLDLDTTGQDWTAHFQFASDLDLQFGFYIQQVCNVPLFSPKCGMLRSAWQNTGAIFSMSGATVVITGPATTGALNQADHYFQGGDLQTGTGANFETRFISDSSVALVGSVYRQTLTLNKPLFKAVVGQSASVWRGCDGTMDTCRLIFNNQVNQRGHPNVPINNPSANVGDVQTQSGGKKG